MNQKILLTLIIVIYTILLFILYKFFPTIKNNIKWFVGVGTTIIFIVAICIIVFSKEKYTETKPRFVYIVPSYNNKDWYKRNIDSMIYQKNTNWHMIYIDDCSDDGTFDLVKEYLSDKGMMDKCTLIRQDKQYGQAYNRYLAYHLCNDEDVCILLDGDDWLIDDTVLDYLDDFMKREDVDMTYGFFKYFVNGKTKETKKHSDYSKECVLNKTYRDIVAPKNKNWKAVHLRVMKAKYLKNINPFDFLDPNLNMIRCCTDWMESLSCLEQSNGRHKIVDRYLMVYNRDNSVRHKTSYYNKINKDYRKIIEDIIKGIKPYTYSPNKKNIAIVDIEDKNYKHNLSEYLNIKNEYDLLLLPKSKEHMYQNKIKKYDKIIYLQNNNNPIRNNLSKKDNHTINEFYKILESIPKFKK